MTTTSQKVYPVNLQKFIREKSYGEKQTLQISYQIVYLSSSRGTIKS